MVKIGQRVARQAIFNRHQERDEAVREIVSTLADVSCGLMLIRLANYRISRITGHALCSLVPECDPTSCVNFYKTIEQTVCQFVGLASFFHVKMVARDLCNPAYKRIALRVQMDFIIQ